MNAVTPLTERGCYGAQTIRTERDTEYDVISRVTRMLRQAGPDCRSPDATMAIHKNNELWTILASDLAHPGNSLPDEVKAGLLSLAGFVLRHGQAVLGGGGSLQPLVDINLAVMRGLRGEASA